MKTRFTDLWSQNNYVFYVIDGRKVQHTALGSYDLKKGSCVFIQKGASIIEQFFDIGFCLVLFFIPDQFICETLMFFGLYGKGSLMVELYFYIGY